MGITIHSEPFDRSKCVAPDFSKPFTATWWIENVHPKSFLGQLAEEARQEHASCPERYIAAEQIGRGGWIHLTTEQTN